MKFKKKAMDTQQLVSIEIFCQHHNVPISFISSMQEFGLLEIIVADEFNYIPTSQLAIAEKLVRLHNDLEINTEGIDVVVQLLQRMKTMQEEMVLLKSRLNFYESDLYNASKNEK